MWILFSDRGFVSVSVLPYRGRRKQPESAGGQRLHRGLPDGAGHSQHLHPGVQGTSRRRLHNLPFHDTRGISVTGSLWKKILKHLVFSDPADFRSRSQPPDEEGVPGAPVLPADLAVGGGSQTGLRLTPDLHSEGEPPVVS